jgi:hypothetical protein
VGTIRKYAFVLALALSVIYVYGPLSLEDAGKPRWLEDINVLLNKSFALSKPEGVVSPVGDFWRRISPSALMIHEQGRLLSW